MLCQRCRRQVARATICAGCGTPAPGAGAAPPLELVLADATRIALTGELTIGRSRANGLWLDDPSVSRTHARIDVAADGTAWLQDAGSSFGTLLDGVRLDAPAALRDGATIAAGNQRLEVRAPRSEAAAGRTIVVPLGASLLLPAVGAAGLTEGATGHGERPRLRSGWALKRLDASEGARRWVVRDLGSDRFLALGDDDARLLALVDGSRSLADLVAEARAAEPAGGGPARLARLLAELGDRGMLAGVDGGALDEAAPRGWRRALRTRERSFAALGPLCERLYRAGGWLAFTRPALVLIALVAAGGLAAFAALVAGRYGTPFVVAEKLPLGALVFLVGRALLVVVHEAAHGLAMASVGRRVHRAGVKLVVVFPYAFVDTSEVWFEPRRRRTLVSAAGPVSDVALAGLFAIACLLLAPGSLRDVAFQVAFAGYVAAFFNLNPFLERDGYHMLSDRLGVPALRERARAQLRRRLAGEPPEGPVDPALTRYAVAGLGWSLAAVAIIIVLTMRYVPILEQVASPLVVRVVLGTLYAAACAPLAIVLAPPLLERLRRRRAEATA